MRHPQWTIQLPETLGAAMSRPFSWGEHDCCLFAADCALAVCGIDIAEKVRGRYKTKSGAMRVLKSEFGDLESGLSSFFIEIEPTKATRGDIVMFNGDEGKTLGVLWAGKVWSVTERGVLPVNHQPIKAWRVE
ncbi:hypothetical protein JZM10_03020 [Providencia rettgeri]|uniref:DUF6950 family protein n=1 Tax=Providencia rettgeri TaxID=587 RepID=UPI00197FC92B|nr:hypothetical protein [Providencia rettgeri]MBN6350438.1 hypothetical protein [Providencia rettgeri]MBQ0210124.1 hypothetical protein [Providencia rettgeri]MCG9949208.1 hypothetical protein [Providencia rettgeri]MDR9615313.1 hypothetical protein [Providencia rettgeri]